MGMLVWLSLFLGLGLISIPSNAENQCRANQDTTFSRKWNIDLPDGRTISIVGHRHPTRSEEEPEENLENRLSAYFINHEGLEGTERNQRFREQIIPFAFNWDLEAHAHFTEDYIMLQKLFAREGSPYNVIGVESALTDYASNYGDYINARRNPSAVIEEVVRLKNEGIISPGQTTGLLSIHLSPGVYLQHTDPGLMRGRRVMAMATSRIEAGSDLYKSLCERPEYNVQHWELPRSFCAPNDRREVDNILAQNESVIYFVGRGHVRSMMTYLEDTCRRMLEFPDPAERPLLPEFADESGGSPGSGESLPTNEP